MIRVHLMGGLGNTLFQWGFGQSLSLVMGVPVQYQVSKGLGSSGYCLDRYNIDVPQTNDDGEPIYRENGMQFNPDASKQPDGTFFIGFWQSEKYLNPYIRSKLRTPRSLSEDTIAMAARIAKTSSVSIHMRRGDNLYPGALTTHGNLAETNYYERAIRRVRELVFNPTFFIFSDEPEWCEINFRPDPSIVVPKRPPEEDIWLISQCKHGICANSTFSWWGNWLNPNLNRLVIAPQRWFVTPTRDARDIVPGRWEKL